ncbi:hypothetical protein F4801DRAFT_62576 [Xylaria longipes]|nr:hypothetical protein F4801DRAFT_62576 [Xylaria longipes]
MQIGIQRKTQPSESLYSNRFLSIPFLTPEIPSPQRHTDKLELALVQMEDLAVITTPASKGKVQQYLPYWCTSWSRCAQRHASQGQENSVGKLVLKTTYTPHTCICTLRRRMAKPLRCALGKEKYAGYLFPLIPLALMRDGLIFYLILWYQDSLFPPIASSYLLCLYHQHANLRLYHILAPIVIII